VASTGTKNAAYSDVLYVEALVGSDTIGWRGIRPATSTENTRGV
jgi:hypothetical protein